MADDPGDEPPGGGRKRPKIQQKLTSFIKKQKKNEDSSDVGSYNSGETETSIRVTTEETTSSMDSAEEFDSDDDAETSETQVSVGRGGGRTHKCITLRVTPHI